MFIPPPLTIWQFLSLSNISFYLSIYLYLSFYLSLSVFLSLSLSLSFSLSLTLFLCPLQKREGILLCTCRSVGLSVCPSVTFSFPINNSRRPWPTFLRICPPIHPGQQMNRVKCVNIISVSQNEFLLHTFVQLSLNWLIQFYKTSFFRGHTVLQTSLVYLSFSLFSLSVFLSLFLFHISLSLFLSLYLSFLYLFCSFLFLSLSLSLSCFLSLSLSPSLFQSPFLLLSPSRSISSSLSLCFPNKCLFLSFSPCS